MRKRIIALAALCCLLLGGCSWLDGEYHSVTPHKEQIYQGGTATASAGNYMELRTVLAELVSQGTEQAVIDVSAYDQTLIQGGLDMAVRYARDIYPIGAYAVESIDYELGASGGAPAVAVNISYRHGRTQIRKIQEAASLEDARGVIAKALQDCDASVVILVDEYEEADFVQVVDDYAASHPEIVMERPQTAVGIYPNNGQTRVVELIFTYQTSRESLRQMQEQVRPIFSSASLYVGGDTTDYRKFSQLFAFLMERFDYTVETSITPSYSLLWHGVGDSKAFAEVYAAMCRQAGLECLVVPGTRDGQSWYWNIVCDNGVYYHVDLLRCSEQGGFRERADAEMLGYVWDYSAYPDCVQVWKPEVDDPAETTAPTEITE